MEGTRLRVDGGRWKVEGGERRKMLGGGWRVEGGANYIIGSNNYTIILYRGNAMLHMHLLSSVQWKEQVL